MIFILKLYSWYQRWSQNAYRSSQLGSCYQTVGYLNLLYAFSDAKIMFIEEIQTWQHFVNSLVSDTKYATFTKHTKDLQPCDWKIFTLLIYVLICVCVCVCVCVFQLWYGQCQCSGDGSSWSGLGCRGCWKTHRGWQSSHREGGSFFSTSDFCISTIHF